VLRAFTTELRAARLTVAAELAAGAPPDSAAAIAAAAVAASPPEVVVGRPTGDPPMKGIAYYGPGMAMFFVLFAIGFTARGFFAEQKEGTLDRMAAAPIPPSALLAGKALSVFVYALASLGTMAVVMAVVFGASWGSPVGVVALCVGMASAVVALAALVMTVARSERQAETMASAVTFTLALLGGSFVFLGAAPSVLRRLSTLTPNGWALRGFTDLATGVPTGQAVLRPVAAMAAFTIVVGVPAIALGRRAVVR
jgi:ABC-2 type transport system permease protein